MKPLSKSTRLGLACLWCIGALLLYSGCNEKKNTQATDMPSELESSSAATSEEPPATKNASNNQPKQEYKFTGKEYYNNISTGDVAAQKKYAGATIEVTGEVEEFGRDQDDYIRLIVNPDAVASCKCSLLESEPWTVTAIGNRVTLRGVYDGEALTKCTIVNAEGMPTLSTTAQELAERYLKEPQAAENELDEKPVVIKGEVARNNLNDEEFSSFYIRLVLRGSNDLDIPVHYFPFPHEEDFKPLKPGDQVLVSGKIEVVQDEEEKYHIGIGYATLLKSE